MRSSNSSGMTGISAAIGTRGSSPRAARPCDRVSLPIAATNKWCEITAAEFMLAFLDWVVFHWDDRAAADFTGPSVGGSPVVAVSAGSSPFSGRMFRYIATCSAICLNTGAAICPP